MKSFKRNQKVMGKETEQVIALPKEFAVLNYVPVDYKFTASYVEFIKEAETRFRRIIKKTSVDDLCDTMLDCYIDSEVNRMKEAAKEQYTYHVYSIAHYRGLLNGEIVKAEGHLDNLRKDLCGLEEKILLYDQIRSKHNIL